MSGQPPASQDLIAGASAVNQGWWRPVVGWLGWTLLLVSLGAAAGLTGWSLLALLGTAPAPSPGGHALASSDLASMAVAGATLLLATVTGLFAVFTRRRLDQGRRELLLAEKAVRSAQEQAKKQAEQGPATQPPAPPPPPPPHAPHHHLRA